MDLISNLQEDISKTIPFFPTILPPMHPWAERLTRKFKEVSAKEGWSMRDFAERAGVPYDTVNKCLRGDVENPRGDTMHKLAKALGVTEPWLRYGTGLEPRGDGAAVDNPQRAVVATQNGAVEYAGDAGTWPKDLKIIGYAKAGMDGFFLDQGEHHGMAFRPPSLIGVSKAFAVYCRDQSMLPAFEPGWVLWVHPTKPAAPGNNVIIELADGQAFIKRLVRRTSKEVICQQWNPKREIRFEAKKVKHLYLVVGAYQEG